MSLLIIPSPRFKGASLAPPILLCLAPHGLASGVLHLDPIRRTPAAVDGIPALAHDAFEPELAGMAEHLVTVVVLHVVVVRIVIFAFGQRRHVAQ